MRANECANELRGSGHTNKTTLNTFHNNVCLLKINKLWFILNHFSIEYFIIKAEFPQHDNW